jgi:glutathione S-transferase
MPPTPGEHEGYSAAQRTAPLMLELLQFRHSSFCEKARLILAAKGLEYRVIEVTPGLGQLELFRLSGQRQVPVLVDGAEVIADSSAIAQYLERQVPTPPLIPEDPAERARVLLLEDWADTALASGVRQALLQAASSDAVVRGALLPEATPAVLRSLVGALPTDLLTSLGDTIGQTERRQLQANLEQLAVLLAPGRFLVGDRLSLADLAVAAQLSLLLFPASSGAPLAGRGVPGLADHPLLTSLFAWRDGLYLSLGRIAVSEPVSPTTP